MIISAPGVLTAETGASAVTERYVVIDEGRVAAVGAGDPASAADVALPDGVLVPGFVDLQVNG